MELLFAFCISFGGFKPSFPHSRVGCCDKLVCETQGESIRTSFCFHRYGWHAHLFCELAYRVLRMANDDDNHWDWNVGDWYPLLSDGKA